MAVAVAVEAEAVMEAVVAAAVAAGRRVAISPRFFVLVFVFTCVCFVCLNFDHCSHTLPSGNRTAPISGN